MLVGMKEHGVGLQCRDARTDSTQRTLAAPSLGILSTPPCIPTQQAQAPSLSELLLPATCPSHHQAAPPQSRVPAVPEQGNTGDISCSAPAAPTPPQIFYNKQPAVLEPLNRTSEMSQGTLGLTHSRCPADLTETITLAQIHLKTQHIPF